MRAATLAAVVVALSLAAAVSPRGANAAVRPNVLLILADDMRRSDLAVMPQTRRLIGEAGVRFTRSYVSFPMCCPARATIYSGQYSHNNGVQGNRPPLGGIGRLTDRGNLVAPWLQQAGYHTAHIGKYLNGYGNPEPATPQPGWSQWLASLDVSTYRMWGYTLLENGKPVTYGGQNNEHPFLYQTDVYRAKAEEIIRARAKARQPFFLDVSFLAPHLEVLQPGNRFIPPRSAPRHRGRFATAPLPQSPAFDEPDTTDKPAWLQEYPRLTPAQIGGITNVNRGRLESLLALDEAVAGLIRVLRETRQLRRTYVVFTSDNGYFLGEHRIPNGKWLPHEPSSRVPLLIRGPGIPAGRRSRALVGNVDLAPTFSDIANVRPGRVVDGRSLLPFARHPKRRSKRPLLLATGPTNENVGTGPGRPAYKGVRAGDFKYVEYADGGRELYDLRRDPEELVNRVADPRFAGVARRLARVLLRLSTCRGASCRSAASVRRPRGLPR